MAAGSSSPPPLRIVIFPWLAFGHLLPYLELAELLASRDHRVSFISTPGNIARLPPLRPAAAPRVESSTSSCRHSTASPHTSPSSWAPLAPTSDRGPTVSSSIASSTGPPPPLWSTRCHRRCFSPAPRIWLRVRTFTSRSGARSIFPTMAATCPSPSASS
uniref:Glycosyltransferase family 28 N-terminal domain-containing protein n=1 Tax=Setaria viridis TaxID=4556 RepID=A0A4U6SY46_SETVI|nr:hypothetical protein SEVIR_9G161240v2 [Setaria viridis]